MKKLYFVLITFLSVSKVTLSQNTVDWAVKEPGEHDFHMNMLCDKDTNTYIYTGGYVSSASYLLKFSPAGNLLINKIWNGISFFPKTIIYDGSNNFYFTGVFSGSGTVDGIPFSSKGGEDGMIGGMDANGTVLWIQTFGSSKNEEGNGLCFGPSQNSLIVTGKITDSLVIGNTYVDQSTQSTLIAQFSLSGTFQNYKLIDFLPQRDNVFNGAPGMENNGREIYKDAFGNYLMLSDREGKHSLCCSNDTLNAPEEGKYVVKMNNSFDTLWTTFIVGPGCYYGWDCGSLTVSAGGDVYIPSLCNGHYGGDRTLRRLDKNTGNTTWSIIRPDGGPLAAFAEGNTLYTCGIDSADYCPCPSQYGGYSDMKKYDQFNAQIDSMKFDQPRYFNKSITFENIIRDNYGHTFIHGTFYEPYVVFGTDTVKGDSVMNNGYNGKFLLRINNAANTSLLTSAKTNFIFEIYPNPSSGSFEIKYSGKGNSDLRINIIDARGKSVHSENFVKAQPEFKKVIDLSKEAKGLYLIEVFDGRERSSKKILLD
ncbi:MAG: T9SS type A sorting domain-containing protein [Bacteroidia bacterium]